MRLPDSALFVGLDVSRKDFVACLLNRHGEKLLTKSFTNNSDGADELSKQLISTVNDNHLTHIFVALESTSYYGIHIANHLSTDESLTRFMIKVYCLNAKTIANYRKSFVDIDKTDSLDAYVIADFVRCGRVSTSSWRGCQYLALQRLTRHRMHIVKNISREKAFASTNIYLKLSSLQKGYPFSNVFGATSSAIIIDCFSPDEIVEMPFNELVSFLCDKGKNHFDNADATAKILRKAAKDSYRLDKTLYDPINTAIASSFNIISAFEQEKKVIDKAILKTVKGLNDNAYTILNSIPGIGPVFSAGIIAEMQSIDAFNSDDALAKYAGLTWRKNQSGSYTADETPLTRTGNKYLRYYVVEATNSIRTSIPAFSNFYFKKYHESLTHHHKRALALTARKFIRLIFALLHKNQLYSANKSES